MKLMGTFRRWVLSVSLLALIAALSWHYLLSFCIREAALLCWGSKLSFQEMRIENGVLVLEEAHLVKSSSLDLYVKKAAIRLSLKNPISLRLVQPHFVFPEGLPNQMLKRSGSKKIALEIEDGTYEIGGASPLTGNLSYRDKTLLLDGGGGILAAAGSEERIECSFEKFPLAPFSRLFECLDLYPVDGFLSGFLHIAKEKTTGRLSLDSAGWMSPYWSAAGGVGLLEVEGEAELGLGNLRFDWKRVQRLAVRLKDLCAVRKSSRIESLTGILSFNEGVGFRWELDGKEFSWHGKSFFRQDGDEWLQSRLSIAKAVGALDMKMEDSDRLWTLALNRADPAFFQWISDFGPKIDWPCKFKGGELNAKLLCKERDGHILEWRASRLEGSNLAISSADWDFACGHLLAAAGCKEMERESFEGSLKLDAGRFTLKTATVADLYADLSISQGKFQEGNARALYNGMESTASFSGCLHEILAEIRVRGSWSDFCNLAGFNIPGSDPLEASLLVKGDLDAFSVSFCLPFAEEEKLLGSIFVDGFEVCEASLAAKRFDFSRIDPSWGGAADLSVSYRDAKWSGKVLGDDLFFKWKDAFVWIPTLETSGVYENERLFASAKKVAGEASLLGEAVPFTAALFLENRLLSVLLEEADFAGIDVAGECLFALEQKIPFSFEATRLQGDLRGAAEHAGLDLSGKIESAFFCLDGASVEDPSSWNWAFSGRLFKVAHQGLQDAEAFISADSKTGLLSLTDLKGGMQIGESKFPIRGFAQYEEAGWRFDVRMEDRFRTLARLSGFAEREAPRISFQFDPEKSHVLGARLQVQECKTGNEKLETLKLASKVCFKDLRSWRGSLGKIDKRVKSLLDAPFEGTLAIEVDLRANALSLVRIEGEEAVWKGQGIPLQVALFQSGEKWKIEELQIGDFVGEANFFRTEDGWGIEGGALRYKEGAEVAVTGMIGPDLQCELSLESLCVKLQKSGFEKIFGEVYGSGSVNVDWRDDFRYEADLDLVVSPLAADSFLMENAKPLQLHFSKRQGLLIRGVDLKVRKPNWENSSLYGRIGLVQYDLAERRWHLHHSHLRLPTDSFALLLEKLGPAHPVAGILASLDPKNDLECYAELSFTDDFSHFSCSMKEGFIPFLGAVRHLQNVDLRYGKSEASIDFLALHQGNSIKIGASLDLDKLSGQLTFEDEGRPLEEGERALAVKWEINPNKGFVIHSIEGSFGGIEASFHEEVQEKGSSLIGSAKLDFEYLSSLISPRIGRVFNELKMGKGYELKGRFFYGLDWKEAHFIGLLSGKNCELCGWQIRSLLSQIEIRPTLVRLFELKGSDAAGILKIDQLTMSQTGEDPWEIVMPNFKLLEFRPSLLKKIGREVGTVGPLVIRELEMTDFHGELEESITYTAKGSLSFINSFKREHTLFDLPSDVLGRIFGLDLELLIPVKGSITFDLKEGKFWLADLAGAYSEGKRSKFFLVKEGVSPTIDLDGNVNILVKMKQYVLFKFTENFLLSIDGSLESPSYSLQKKSRVQ